MLIPKSLYIKNFLSFKEQFYSFKNGKTVCIMGNNLTDEGQKSNGSGKSAFFTALEFIHTGNFSRKVSKTKLVFRGEKFAEVHYVAFNNIKNEYLQIERYLPVKGSEKVSVYLYKDVVEFEQEKESYQVDIATTADANKWIEAYIGISKEDLMNYFLPNELTYKSFFDSSDTAKKELIGRFSNSEVVDPAFIKVSEAENKVSEKIVKKEIELTKLENSLQIRIEDLEKEQERDVKQENLDNIKIIEGEITKIQSEIKVKKVEINDILVEVSNYTKDIKKYQETSKTLLKSIENKSKEIEKFKKDSKDFKEEYKKFEKDEIKCKNSISKTKEVLSGIEEDEHAINKDIVTTENNLAGEIECPFCHKKFVLSEDFTLEELEQKQKEYKKELAEVLEDKETTNKSLKKFKEKQDQLDKEISLIEDQETEYTKSLKKYTDELSKITKESNENQDEISKIERKIVSKNEDIKSKKSLIQTKESLITTKEDVIKEIKEAKIDKTKEKSLKKEIKEYEVSIKELNTSIQELNHEKENIAEWNSNFTSFKSFLANKKLKVIEGMINKYLVDMKASYQLKLEGYKMVGKEIREKITPYIFQDGEFCEFGEFSHGERGRLNAASLCTFQSLINETSPTGGINLLFPDEIFEGFDELGIELLLKSFGMVEKTILLTTHVTNEKISDNVMMIEKVNRISKIVN